MKNKTVTLTLLLALMVMSIPTAQAIDVAPRISDREIIEKLAGLEAGQKALRSEMRAGQDALRSEMRAGQKALRSEMRAGQDALNIRIDDVNTRISSLEKTMLTMFAALISMVAALLGYLIWDRRTMIRPVIERLDNLEIEIVRDLDLRHADGSRLTRQLKALREYARNDAKLKEILRDLSLM